MTNDTARIVLIHNDRTETHEFNRRKLSLQMEDDQIAIQSYFDTRSQRLELRCDDPEQTKPLFDRLVELLHFPTRDLPIRLYTDNTTFGNISRIY